MKRIYNILAVTILVIMLTGCAKEVNPGQEQGIKGEVMLTLGFIDNSPSAGGAEDNNAFIEAMKVSKLKIFNAETGGIIRSYSPATSAPKEINLINGRYRTTLEVGSNSITSLTERKYYGEETFTVMADKTAAVTINCKLTTIQVNVVFDETVAASFGADYKSLVSTMNTFVLEDAEANSDITLSYIENGVGYFTLPRHVSNISWGFYGTSTEFGAIEKFGDIKAPKPGHEYTLTFTYSETPGGGLDITVTVEDDGVIIDDDFIFDLQPTISGNSFDIKNVAPFFTEPISYNVVGINPLNTIDVIANGRTYTPFANGAGIDISADGILYVATDETNGIITLSEVFFANFNGGINNITLRAVDVNAGIGEAESREAITGLISNPTVDLWSNTARFEAGVTDPSITSVVFKYKTSAAGEWISVNGVRGENYSFYAVASSNWIESKNEANLTIFTPEANSGIFANSSYDYSVTIGATEHAAQNFVTSTAQILSGGDMEDGNMSCFGSSNVNATFWASGNNSAANNLCSFGTYAGMQGSHTAKLSATSTLGILASGNILIGAFERHTFSGTASFGQPFNWEARPRSMKLKYHASLGAANIVKNSSTPLKMGDQDQARIYIAIIDWSARHGVTSGTGSPVGVWDPTTTSSTGEGAIIGYGSYFIKSSTAGNSMIDLEIPIHYYDTTKKPSGRYTIALSAGTSAYGDLMVGCDSSVLYVDDFKFGY